MGDRVLAVYRDGAIYSTKGLRTPHINSVKGYAFISFREKHEYYHRIVAKCFIENPLNKPQVNHKDGNKLNNHFSNLEWATNSENQKHRYSTLGHIGHGRPRNENISWDKTRKRWMAYTSKRDFPKRKYIGRFKTKEAALDALIKFYNLHFGENNQYILNIK